jgi:hypothetical protein
MGIWKIALGSRAFLIEATLTLAAVPTLSYICLQVLPWVEAREGALLNDPLLALFEPMKLDWPVFTLLYCSIFLSSIYLARDPRRVMFFLQAFLVCQALRLGTICITPLDPPVTKIPLRDPFMVFIASNRVFTKDLFFSGHTLTLTLFFLMAQQRWLRWVLAISTTGVVLGVLGTHGHYTIDVVAAFPITYGCFHLVQRFRRHYCWPATIFPSAADTLAMERFDLQKEESERSRKVV